MYESVREKFEICSCNNGYKRFNDAHPIDIYIGLNEKHQKSLIIVSSGNIEDVESSRMINVCLSQREDNRLALSFDLLEDDMSDLFYKFCADIIESTKIYNKMNTINFVIQRWKDWISLFKNPINDLLSELEIKGLLGELIFLKDYMFEKYGIEKSLNAWMGPEMSHKDFEVNDTWYEIKTINQNGIDIKISSIEQLDSNSIGELVVIKLEKSNIETNLNISLNGYIVNLRNIIPEELISIFDRKIALAKYKYESDYDQYIYSLKNIVHYKVNNRFPRITKNSLPNGIIRVSYDILLDNIDEFKMVGE